MRKRRQTCEQLPSPFPKDTKLQSLRTQRCGSKMGGGKKSGAMERELPPPSLCLVKGGEIEATLPDLREQ